MRSFATSDARPAETQRPVARSAEAAAIGVTTGLLLAVTLAMQWHLGAWAAELGYDEASHYISGLMIHDYLAHAAGSGPVRFLTDWHSHYPLVGIGHWGPLFYAVEAVWMLLAGTSRVAALGLSAVISTAIGVVVSTVATRCGGRLTGMLAGLAFVISPIVLKATSEVKLDLPIALLCLCATLTYASWVRESGWLRAAGFSLLAAAALLVKGNGGCMGLLPPLVVLAGRRWDLPRRWTFWLPLPVVGLLTAPWYLSTFGLVEAGFRFEWGWDFTQNALLANAAILLTGAGPLLLAAGLLGFGVAFARHREADPTIICLAALLAAVCVFQVIVPAAIQDRYMIPALPPLLILAAWILGRPPAWIVPRSPLRPAWHAPIMAVLVFALLPGAARLAPKQQFGMLEAAARVWTNLPPANQAVLVVGHGEAEVAAVAALAERDPKRPSLFVVRGSRLLGGGGYNRTDYQPRFDTPLEAMAAIDDLGIPLVILVTRDAGDEWEHVDQMAAAGRLFPDRLESIWRQTEPGYEARLLRVRNNVARAVEAGKLRQLSAPRHLTERQAD